MITNEEARKAIEKYQKEHPLQFGVMMDVTAISSKEGAEIISQTIKKISKKAEKDTELWCICEMAKMYMQGVRPVYPVRPQSEWIPVSERLPEENGEYLVTLEYVEDSEIVYETDMAKFVYSEKDDCNNGFHKAYTVIAWRPSPEPYTESEEEE